MRYLSVCSGMEAASVAWHPLGWKPVGFSEIEPFPCAILKHRFPNVPNYGSLTEYKQWPLAVGDVQLLCGGTPCQSFSVAGLRRGLDDPRGNLALVFLGLADKLKPRWIVWENVPGVLSSASGRDFGSFLGALVELGYGFAYRVLDAQHFGVPQRRRRVFVVACLGDWRAPAEVLLESDCVRRDIKKGRAKGEEVTGSLGSRSSAGGGFGTDFDCAGGLQAVAYRKSKRACSTTDNETWVEADALAITFQPGNLRREAGAEPSTTTTTTLKASAGDQMPHVAIVQASELRLRGQITEQTTSPTLLAQTKSGDNDPLAVHPVAGFKWHQGSQAGSIGYEDGIAPTITTVKEPGVIHPVVPLDGMNLLSRLGKCGEEHSMQNFDPNDPQFTLRKGGAQHGVLTPMAVRRLTPVECERLQGFPDNWSRISWKGKPEDQCPDGPRYKACGNSMAVPVMRWIGERIAAADAKHFPNA